MAERHLNRPDIGPRLEQMSLKAVAKGMDGVVLAQARIPSRLHADPVDGADVQRPFWDVSREEPLGRSGWRLRKRYSLGR
jgi:hypothetical protein